MDAGVRRRRERREPGEGGGRPLTCPYTWIGSGCRAALRLLRSGFSSALRGAPRAPRRSSSGSPRTTRKPRSWGPGARPPGSVGGQTSPRAPGGSSAIRVKRKGSRDSLLLLRVAMFGRTRPQVAPPPGENVQREAGTPAGRGRARRSRGSRPPCCARRRRVPLCSARPRHVGGSPPRPLRALSPLRPLLREGMGKSRQRARGPVPWQALLVARAPCGNQESRGARPSSLEFSPPLPGRVEVVLNRGRSPLPTAQPPVPPHDHLARPLSHPHLRGSADSQRKLAPRTRRAR